MRKIGRFVNFIMAISFLADIAFITVFPLLLHEGTEAWSNGLTLYIFMFYIGPLSVSYYIYLMYCFFDKDRRINTLSNKFSYINILLLIIVSNYNAWVYVILGNIN